MGCASCCGKAILITTNLLFLLFGLLFLALGIAIKYSFKYIEGPIETFKLSVGSSHSGVTDFDLGPLINNVAIALIVIGVIVFVIAILGMCGACCNNLCMLATYATVVLLLLIIEVVLVILVATGEFNGIIKAVVKKIIRDDYEGLYDFGLKSIIINLVQIFLQCCGVDDSTDYDVAVKWKKVYNDTNGQRVIVLPVTCCKDFPANTPLFRSCLTNPDTTNSNKDRGCFDDASSYITDEYRQYAIIAVCTYLIDHLLLVVIAIYLAVRIGKRKKRRGNYNDGMKVTVETTSRSRY